MTLRSGEAGFTLIEMSIVVSVMAIIIPATWMLQRRFQADALRAAHETDAAEGMRAFSEELRADLRTLHSGREGLTLEGACGTVHYLIEQGVLIRDGGSGCGGRRALARSVTGLTRTGNLVEVTFETEIFRLGLDQP
jgi:prepilin-type N-terminal cleavage/methylation domain-containing protein